MTLGNSGALDRRTVAALAACLGLALLPGLAAAAPADLALRQDLPPKMVFALLFLMLGPIKILAPFAAMTRGCDARFRLRLATRAVLFSAAALLIAGLIGRNMLENFAIPVPVLALTGGLVLFLIALQAVLEQFAPHTPPSHDAPPPTLALALSPLAFPTIVTPYGIAAMTIFMTLAEDDPERKLVIAALVAAILLMDWVAMLFAHTILKYLGTMLQIFAVVLGVNQIALGLLVMLRSLSRIGLFTMQVQ